MNRIDKKPLADLGYGFITANYLQKDSNEYLYRNKNITQADYRQLSAREISIMEANLNEAENWKDIWVKDGFNPYLVKNCRFFGLIRIGILESCYLEFKNLRMPVGCLLYTSPSPRDGLLSRMPSSA